MSFGYDNLKLKSRGDSGSLYEASIALCTAQGIFMFTLSTNINMVDYCYSDPDTEDPEPAYFHGSQYLYDLFNSKNTLFNGTANRNFVLGVLTANMTPDEDQLPLDFVHLNSHDKVYVPAVMRPYTDISGKRYGMGFYIDSTVNNETGTMSRDSGDYVEVSKQNGNIDSTSYFIDYANTYQIEVNKNNIANIDSLIAYMNGGSEEGGGK